METNEELIERLVAGAVSGEEYRRSILALDSHPQLWRDCALAFLQEQAIGQELQQLAGVNVDWESPRRQVSLNSLYFDRSSTANEPTVEALPDRALASSVRHPAAYRWAAVAAMFLLSFTGGWYGSSFMQKSPPLSSASQLAQDSGQDSIAPNAGLLAGNTGTTGRSSAPARDMQSSSSNLASNLDFVRNNSNQVGNSKTSWLPMGDQIPIRLRELERSGRIRINSSNALIPVDYKDGTSVLVPVQQLHIVPTVYAY